MVEQDQKNKSSLEVVFSRAVNEVYEIAFEVAQARIDCDDFSKTLRYFKKIDAFVLAAAIPMNEENKKNIWI